MITSSLVLLRKQNRIQTFLLQENRLVLAKSYEEAASSLGNIYIGKVKNVVSSIHAAFVEYASDTIGFLALQSVQNPILTNRTYDGRILQGDELVVQVEKEGIKTKAPGLTTNLSFSGKYCVLTTGKTKLGYSSKLTETVKQQVKAFLEAEELPKLLKSRQIGLVVRTNVSSLEEYAPLKEEILALKEKLEAVKEAAPHRTCFSGVYSPLPEYIAGIRDLYDNSYERIVTDDAALYEELQAQACLLAAPVSFYQDEALSLEKLYGIESKLQEALSERVWLKSGGYLVIQPTEALTVIDVNSGKLLKSAKGQNSFFLTNKEAAEEIALQIRLRNLSGIIIVDFINQEDTGLDKELLHYLQSLLKKDSVKTDVIDMTPLGLVEITRKKVSKSLREQFRT